MARAAQIPRARTRPPWVELLLAQTLALLAAFAFAAAIASIIILLSDENPFSVFSSVWRFSTARPQDFATVLEYATPLIFSGLAVAVAFRAGMFNIGVEGQYIVGMAAAAAAATTFTGLPAVILLPLVVLSSVAAGAAWAAVPGLLKVKTGAHEVVTTIMMDGIAVSFVAWLILHPLRSSERGLIELRTDTFPDAALMPSLTDSLGLPSLIPGSVHLTWFFVLALVACAGTWFLLFRTRLGYEARAVGSASTAAEAGGISIGAVQLKLFLISGALAGFVGLNYLLGDKGYLPSNYESGLGFTGIVVAFLGRNHPAGIVLAAILLGVLLRGQDGIAVTTEVSTQVLVILQAVLILSVVVAYEVARRALARRQLET